MRERTDNATFQKRAERFNVVVMDHAAKVPALAVADEFMRQPACFQRAITRVLVGCDEADVVAESLANESIERIGFTLAKQSPVRAGTP